MIRSYTTIIEMLLMNRAFGFAALFGFILALIVHIAALSGVNVSAKMPGVWVLHIGIFIVFIPFVLSFTKLFGQRPKLAELRAAFPAWVLIVMLVLMAYVICNFMLFMAQTEGGSAVFADGKYVLMNRTQVIREITLLEYDAFKANEVRGFSGHWLVFYFAPFAYFMFCRKLKKPQK